MDVQAQPARTAMDSKRSRIAAYGAAGVEDTLKPRHKVVITSINSNGEPLQSEPFYSCYGEDGWECQSPRCDFCNRRREAQAAREQVYRANHAPKVSNTSPELPVVPPPAVPAPAQTPPPPYNSIHHSTSEASSNSIPPPHAHLPGDAGTFRYSQVSRTWEVVGPFEAMELVQVAQPPTAHSPHLARTRRRAQLFQVGPERPFRNIFIGLLIVVILIIVAIVAVQVAKDKRAEKEGRIGE